MSQINNRRPSGNASPYRAGRAPAARGTGRAPAARGTVYARNLTPEQRRRILEMRKRKQRRTHLRILVPAAAAVIALAVVLAIALPTGNKKDQHASLELTAPEAPVETVEAMEATGESGDSTEAAGEVEAAAETNEEPGDAAEGIGEANADGVESGMGAEPAATSAPVQSANAYVPAGGEFVYDDAYAAAALGQDTGPLIVPDLSKVDAAKADRWPEITEGYMPVLYQANTEEKIIAITVDDCFQGPNLQKIIQCALDNNGKLTIFPIGDNLKKDTVASAIKWAWESGFEIENHTYNHAGMYHYDDERMRMEMWYQSMQLNQVLGVNYQEHFFRPKGGDERNDQRVHAYANQMGMKGIAIWTQSGSSNPVERLVLAPGAIYLFHTTNTDLSRLLEFIPLATREGYRLVTLNEMFGLPENEYTELTAATDPPQLEAFKVIPTMLQKTSYIRAAAVVQRRLIELGWLEGEADGVFGQSSFMATGYFQLAADLQADGKAGPSTQAVLFSDDAPAATAENKAKVAAKMSK